MLPASSGRVGLYLRIPGMREGKSLRPTSQVVALAKDLWLLGISLSLAASRLRSRSLAQG